MGRPLCDRVRISRERLAFLCDSTASPVCALLLFNGWGALILGQLAEFEVDQVGTLLGCIPYNFYSLAILALALQTPAVGTFPRSSPICSGRWRCAKSVTFPT